MAPPRRGQAPAAQAVVARAADYYDGFDAELGRWFETCPDRAARTGLTRGCVTHVDFGAQRAGVKRPAFGLGGPEPLAPGFFLGGAGIHPGGGVSGGPGRLVSRRVLDYLARGGAVRSSPRNAAPAAPRPHS